MLPIDLWRANNLFEKEEEEECLVGGGVADSATASQDTSSYL
jgi:hypothetical protein